MRRWRRDRSGCGILLRKRLRTGHALYALTMRPTQRLCRAVMFSVRGARGASRCAPCAGARQRVLFASLCEVASLCITGERGLPVVLYRLIL